MLGSMISNISMCNDAVLRGDGYAYDQSLWIIEVMKSTTTAAAHPVQPYDEREADPLLDQLASAKQSGDFDAMGRITQVLMTKFDAQAPAARPAGGHGRNEPSQTAVPTELVKESEVARAALDQMCPDAAADERLLNMLAAGDVSVALMLSRIERQLAAKMLGGIDGSPYWLALVRLLGDVTRLNANVRGRVQGSLSTAASLRAQRRFLAER